MLGGDYAASGCIATRACSEYVAVKRGNQTAPSQTGSRLRPGYVCGIVWYAGSCYWIYPTMRQYGGLNAPTGFGTLILFSLYLAFYHGAFGLGVSLLAGESPFSRRALLISPFLWVAVELARTRISGFPWDLLGITQVDNVALVHVSRVTGVYGVSFEIMVVNAALAAAFLLARLRVGRERWRSLLLASVIAMAVLQTGRWINPEALIGDRTARLVQQNIPVLEGSEWTNEYSEGTLRDLTWLSLNLAGNQGGRVDLIVWPESPAAKVIIHPQEKPRVPIVNRSRSRSKQSRSWSYPSGKL